MEPHADGHRLLAAVGEHHLLFQPPGREAVYDLALELVREIAEYRIVPRIRIVAAFDQHLVRGFPRLRHGERLALENTVVIVASFRVGDREAVGAPVERVLPVCNAVGREEDRQSEHMRAPPELFDLIPGGCTQDFDAAPRVGQPHEVGAHVRNQQGRVVPFRKLHGPHSMPRYAAQHLRAAFRSWRPAHPSMRRRPACPPVPRP